MEPCSEEFSSEAIEKISNVIKNDQSLVESYTFNSNKGKENHTVSFYNPFELTADALHLPTVSPSLFREVVSPSVKEDKKFAWSIDQLAVLHPSNIETTPFSQFEMPTDPEYEKKAQEAIDSFFSSTSVVPSPWTNQSHKMNVMSAFWAAHALKTPLSSASPQLQGDIIEPPVKASTWSQTTLSLPPVLPKEIEDALAPFCNFHQDQSNQSQEELEESTNPNNTTLRRKLLFSSEERASSRAAHSEPTNDSLPLEDEATVDPWGSSMIRPSSRMTQSPPPSPTLWNRQSISPIRRVSPADFRTLLSPSNSNEGDSSSSPKSRKLKTPELSPIGMPEDKQYSTPLTVNTLYHQDFLSRLNSEAQMDTDIHTSTSPNDSLLQIRPLENSRSSPAVGRELSREPLADISNSESPLCPNKQEPSEPFRTFASNNCSLITSDEDFYTQDFSDGENDDSAMSTSYVTPQVGRNHKQSPHFSSSPIRESGSSCRRSTTRSVVDGLKPSSSSLSDSPPVSPISWRLDSSDLPGGGRYGRSKFASLRTIPQFEATDVHMDSQQSFEGSFSGEPGCSNTQETGYYSGASSLQITNSTLPTATNRSNSGSQMETCKQLPS